FEVLHGSVVHDLVRQAGNISVHVIAGEATDEEKKPVGAIAPRPKFDPKPFFAAAGVVVIALACSFGLQQWLALANLSILFLTGVLVVAARYGLWPSLFAGLLSVLAYNFFFLPPRYTFTIADPENVLTLITFLIAAVIASNLAAGTRAQ